MTLFELVFGRYPFELKGESVRERLESHMAATIDFPQNWPQGVPRDFAQVIEKMLAKNPADRFNSFRDLERALQLIQPVNTTTAAIAPRVMAYVADQIFLLLCLVPFVVPILFLMGDLSRLARFDSHPGVLLTECSGRLFDVGLSRTTFSRAIPVSIENCRRKRIASSQRTVADARGVAKRSVLAGTIGHILFSSIRMDAHHTRIRIGIVCRD